MLPSQEPTEKMIFSHNSESSRFLSKIVIILFIALQMIAGFMFSNFYNEFKDLEDQVNVLDHKLQRICDEFNLLLLPSQVHTFEVPQE